MALTLIRLGVALMALFAWRGSAAEPMRRESSVQFTVDAAFQAQGGVQFFYQLIRDTPSPEATNETFRHFLGLDRARRWQALNAPAHVVLSRLVFRVARESSFFNSARANDIRSINQVAPAMQVTANGDGTFRVGRRPSNTLRIEFLDSAKALAMSSAGTTDVVWSVFAFTGETQPPTSMVFQENTDFARVLGMRTAEASVTWTAHHALSPSETQITVLTMSYIRTLPPFFLGGESRMLQESMKGARELIDGVRAAARL